jgi:hypothetical protein
MPFQAHLPDAQFFGVVAAANYMDGRRSNSLFDHADCFGVDRVMFVGNRPVSELATSYQRPDRGIAVFTASTSLNEMAKIVLRQRD